MRFLITLFILGSGFYLFTVWSQRKNLPAGSKDNSQKSRRFFRGKSNPQEVWVQVYETASLQEARILQARLQEEEVDCVLYEQGKKDIHGNSLKGIGIAVPRTAAPHAQTIISRMPV